MACIAVSEPLASCSTTSDPVIINGESIFVSCLGHVRNENHESPYAGNIESDSSFDPPAMEKKNNSKIHPNISDAKETGVESSIDAI
nr:unnamed protein product [Callosobruchus analis]